MRNEMSKSFKGNVTVEAEGNYPEQFVNKCVKEGVQIWNVAKLADGVLQFDIALTDIPKMRKLFRQSGMKIRFKQRRGIPFLINRMKIRVGFAVGMLLFIGIILFASNMVWGHTIKGATPHVEQKLNEVIQEIGIEKGALAFRLPKPDEIQRIVTDRISEATWIGVRKKGTTYEFEVVEQVRQTEPERLSPRHLVASKKAVIRKMFVEDGKAVTRTNEVVNEGDLLVSGFIGVEGEEQTIAAKASIIGEIWYTSTISMPMEQTFTALTGEQKNKRMITFGDVEIPYWNFTKPDYAAYETFEKETNLSLFGYRLPFQFSILEQRETFAFKRAYTKEEAIDVLKKQAREELKGKLPDEAEIKTEHILQEVVENDTVSIKIHYQVLEEIAQEKPIIQGD
ncbi:hypothetical protein JOC54_001326 [Alkalihalobacillus xiaoxiensis]|uniref:Sporulation protein YqfD n=1 Tax=Shouchella xiaoxiensis TaxID=766895 RepID=A0ABS2STF7_9BACI|nr:sporulation protein YqfD [Shouchella xiaoxiensis]MBM7838095.1 hypothetical protein [Shouchella xiaoxiensis]